MENFRKLRMTVKSNLHEENEKEKEKGEVEGNGEGKENMIMRGENNEKDKNEEKSSQLVICPDPVLDRAIFDRYVCNCII